MAFWGEGSGYFPGATDPAYNAYMDQTYGYQQAPAGGQATYTVTTGTPANGPAQAVQQPPQRAAIPQQAVPRSVVDTRYSKRLSRASIAALGPYMW